MAQDTAYDAMLRACERIRRCYQMHFGGFVVEVRDGKVAAVEHTHKMRVPNPERPLLKPAEEEGIRSLAYPLVHYYGMRDGFVVVAVDSDKVKQFDLTTRNVFEPRACAQAG